MKIICVFFLVAIIVFIHFKVDLIYEARVTDLQLKIQVRISKMKVYGTNLKLVVETDLTGKGKTLSIVKGSGKNEKITPIKFNGKRKSIHFDLSQINLIDFEDLTVNVEFGREDDLLSLINKAYLTDVALRSIGETLRAFLQVNVIDKISASETENTRVYGRVSIFVSAVELAVTVVKILTGNMKNKTK